MLVLVAIECVCAIVLFPHLINSLYATIINIIDFVSYCIVCCLAALLLLHAHCTLDESISFSMCSTLICIEQKKKLIKCEH